MTIHSFGDTASRSWIQVSIFHEKDYEAYPERNYEKLVYSNEFPLETDYNITIGDPYYDPEGRKYTFLIDDITFLQGGTISINGKGNFRFSLLNYRRCGR